MKGYSLVASLEAARIDQEHRTHYWVRKLALVCNQSGSSSSSVKGSPASVRSINNAFPAQGQSHEVKALGSKFDKLVQELRRGRPEAAPKAIMGDPNQKYFAKSLYLALLCWCWRHAACIPPGTGSACSGHPFPTVKVGFTARTQGACSQRRCGESPRSKFRECHQKTQGHQFLDRQ